MKISFNEQNNMFDLIFQNEKVQISNIQCAVEWFDAVGIMHRFESSATESMLKKSDGKTLKLLFKKNNCPEMEWEITEEKNCLLSRLTAINSTGGNIKIKTLEPFFISQDGNIEIDGKLNQARFLGLQRLCGDIRPQYLWEELYAHCSFSSSMMGCLYNKSTESALTIGFVSTADMFGELSFKFDTFRNLKKFSAFCRAENVSLEPGERLVSEKLSVNIDDSAQNGLTNYTKRLQKEMKSGVWSTPVTGWSTWDYYFGNISEENILENVDFLARHKQEIPVEYIQIDAGYTVDKLYEWENWNERFPHGPAWLVNQ